MGVDRSQKERPMPVTPLFTTPWGILTNKRESKLAAGAITRGATVRPAQRSRYNAFGHSETSTSPLGMGYVEALLGVLLGIVGTIAYDASALRGRVSMRSTGGPSVYDFSWKEEPGRVVLGGFGHSEGQATYQAAIVGLAQLIALHRCGPSPQTGEIVTRWYMLIDAMEAAYARVNQDTGWPSRTIAEAAASPAILLHIKGVADALYHAMRYQLPALEAGAAVPRLAERGLVVTAPDVLMAGEGRATTLPGSVLINPSAGRADALERAADDQPLTLLPDDTPAPKLPGADDAPVGEGGVEGADPPGVDYDLTRGQLLLQPYRAIEREVAGEVRRLSAPSYRRPPTSRHGHTWSAAPSRCASTFARRASGPCCTRATGRATQRAWRSCC
jgi:hypothetical protein